MNAFAATALADPSVQQDKPNGDGKGKGRRAGKDLRTLRSYAEQVQALAPPAEITPTTGKDPISEGLVDPDTDLGQLIEAFNAEGERRVFEEIHYYVKGDPNLTIGFGHFAKESLPDFFGQMLGTGAWACLVAAVHKYLAGNPEQWAGFCKDTKRDPSGPCTLEAVDSGLGWLLAGRTAGTDKLDTQRLLKWSKTKVAGNKEVFNKGDDWFRNAMMYGLNLPAVQAFQLEYWTEHVVEEGEDRANALGIETLGGAATMASADSSGMVTVQPAINAIRSGSSLTLDIKAVEVPGYGTVAGHRETFPTKPTPARVANKSVPEERLVQDWQSLLIWQQYRAYKANRERKRAAGRSGSPQEKAQKVERATRFTRARMRAIWDQWYAGAWGAIPEHAAAWPAAHSGKPMEQGSFLDDVEAEGKSKD